MPLVQPAHYTLVVGGNDWTNYVQDTGWNINQSFTRQGDTATFTLIDDRSSTGSKTPVFVPQSLQTIIFTDTSTSTVLFSGLVTSPTFVRNGPLQTVWSLHCQDWTYIADTTIVAGDFLGKTADAIVISLVATANCGLTATASSGGGYVQPASTINRLQVNYQTLSAALTTLAKLSSQSTDYGWYIDENRAVHFFSQEQVAAPTITLTDDLQHTGSPAGVPTATLGGFSESGFNYVWDGTTIRSSVIVRGAAFPGTFTNKWYGDGTTIQWPLSFALNTGSGSSTPNVSVDIGGTLLTSKNFYIVGVTSGTLPTSGFKLVQALNGQWSLQTFGGRAAPTIGQIIAITYPYQAPVIARSDDHTFQTAYSSLPNNGIFQMYVSDSSLVTLSSAQRRARAELQQYSLIQERVTLTTGAGFLGHLIAGGTFTLVTSYVPDSASSFAPGFTDTFMSTSVSITGLQSGFRSYTVNAVRIT